MRSPPAPLPFGTEIFFGLRYRSIRMRLRLSFPVTCAFVHCKASRLPEISAMSQIEVVCTVKKANRPRMGRITFRRPAGVA